MTLDEHERIREAFDQANLFFFREIVLGSFHALGNHLDGADSSLLLLEAIATENPVDAPGEVLGLVRGARTEIAAAKGLLAIVRQHLRPDPRPVECSLLDDIVIPAINIAQRKSQVILQLTCDKSRDFIIMGNAPYLIEALAELFSNAIHAMKTTQRAERKITVTIQPQDQKTVEIKIRDSGAGVDPAIRPRLFHPFITTRRDGAGLGLYFVNLVVQRAGGRVYLQHSAPEEGTTFALELPYLRIKHSSVRQPGA